MCDLVIEAKRPKLSNESVQEHALTVPNEICPIFKLNNDCFVEIFEYLSVRELYAVGQTCKIIYELAGDYFKCNYSSAVKFSGDNGIYTEFSDNNGAIKQRTQTSGFNKFITQISHYYERMAPLYYIQSHTIEFQSINRINFVCVPLNERRIKCIQKLLHQIQQLQVKNCSVEGDLYETVLKYCDNLECLYIQDADFGRYRSSQHQPKYEWLLQNHPTLVHLELISYYSSYLMELNHFLKHNQNVQRFSTTFKFIWHNRLEFLKCNTKLDILEVKLIHWSRHYGDQNGNDTDDEMFASICNLLQQLHKRGFYKRLHLYLQNISQPNIEQLISLNGLEKLCIKTFSEHFNLVHLTNIKELAILDGANAICMAPIAKSFSKLQRLFIRNATFDVLWTFIRYSANLTKIKFLCTHKSHADDQILKLLTLNKDRSMLPEARKVTIYVPDSIFLATKWAFNNGHLKLDLVEMKRSDSYHWEQHF